MTLSMDHLDSFTYTTEPHIKMKLATVILIVSLSSYSYGQFLNCNWVNSLDCTTYTNALECGTNGITYPNRCYFAKASCLDQDLHILHDGACSQSETSTPGPGMTTTPSIDGGEAVLDFFCTVLSKQPCGNETSPVCGTDGWTYPNYCEYDKARCTHRDDLHVASFGQCP